MCKATQFSSKYYLHIHQQFGEFGTSVDLLRLSIYDDEAKLTAPDYAHADLHATHMLKAGRFKPGYYDLELYEQGRADPIEIEHLVI